MQQKHWIYVAALALVLGTLPVRAQKADKKDEAYRQMSELLEKGDYSFRVQNINPRRGRTITPTSLYTMDAKEGYLKAHLPYFGRAFSASYGGDGGIEFEGKPDSFEIEKNDNRRQITIEFDIEGKNDSYTATLQVGYSGYGTLTISSQKRESISYYGTIVEPAP